MPLPDLLCYQGREINDQNPAWEHFPLGGTTEKRCRLATGFHWGSQIGEGGGVETRGVGGGGTKSFGRQLFAEHSLLQSSARKEK